MQQNMSFTWDSYGSMWLPLVMQSGLKKSFTEVFQMLLYSGSYENVLT
jgi:hypothetical protein